MRGQRKDLDVSVEESDEVDSEEETDAVKPLSFAGKLISDDGNERIISETAFDAYFTRTTSRIQTSNNVFSNLVPPLTAEEYADGMKRTSFRQSIQSRLSSETDRDYLFSRCLRELMEGFNLLMYGYGSKRRILNQFAMDYCSKAGHVVVANAFYPGFTIKDLLTAVETNIPEISSLFISSTSLEALSRRIYDFVLRKRLRLFLVIHNLDAPSLRNPRSKSCLSLLGLNPFIHIVASLDHINSPLLFSSSESSARKPDIGSSVYHISNPPRGFSWLWHDLTTLEPYDNELAYVDRSSLSGAHGGGAPTKKGGMENQSVTTMTESAAIHILASVTQKAQKLFLLIANRQLESIDDAGDGDDSIPQGENFLQQFAIGYDLLFISARDNFIATNDTTLRSLLGEFRDHELIVSAQGAAGAAEMLWIPLRKERLINVLKSI